MVGSGCVHQSSPQILYSFAGFFWPCRVVGRRTYPLHSSHSYCRGRNGRVAREFWWARLDSNQRPRDYESEKANPRTNVKGDSSVLGFNLEPESCQVERGATSESPVASRRFTTTTSHEKLPFARLEFLSFTADTSQMTTGATAPVCVALKQNGGGYVFRLRIAAKPTIARSAATMTIAHSESVGIAPPLPVNGAQVGTLIVVASVVTVV